MQHTPSTCFPVGYLAQLRKLTDDSCRIDAQGNAEPQLPATDVKHPYLFFTARKSTIFECLNMPSSPIPLPVERALLRLGQNLALARRRRHFSQADIAERIGTSVTTVRRMEDGHPGIALQHFARALQVFGELDKLEKLLDSAEDPIGLALMDANLPKRIRAPRRKLGPRAW